MKRLTILLLPMTLLILPGLNAAPKPERITLWDNNAPVGNGKFAKEDAAIHIHSPAKPNGAAVIICPGGGYGMQVMCGIMSSNVLSYQCV